VNGGLGYWDIPGTDLRIYEVIETIDSYAEIHSGPLVGELALLTGRGGIRGEEILGPDSSLKGWRHDPGSGLARWGTHTISALELSGNLLVAEFNRTDSEFEAGLASGDSGGGLFIHDGAYVGNSPE
jgi:hypothetical protein